MTRLPSPSTTRRPSPPALAVTGAHCAASTSRRPGALVATGSLTVDPDAAVGFDIYSTLRKGVAVRNAGFASLVVNGVTGLYRVNLLTGRADLIGAFKDKVIDIALPLSQ